MVIVTALLVAVVAVRQLAFEVITTLTWSPLTNVVLTKVFAELLVPTLVPLTFHWYNGEAPPFVGVAVNVTPDPAHVVLLVTSDEMLTDGVTLALTTKAIELLVAVDDVTHPKLLVITTVMLPPAVPASVYVALLVPTLFPSFFHWYVGVPPLVGVAVNVTDVLLHVGLVPDVIAILTEGVTDEFSVTVAFAPVKQVDLTQPLASVRDNKV